MHSAGSAGISGQRDQRFFGREAELARINDLIRSGQRLITVTAPGGYGKSRLIRELTRQLATESSLGYCEVLLAPVSDPGRIARATADALDLRLRNDTDPRQQLTDFLREKALLLHFDNFEHLTDGAEFIADLLAAATNLVVIVTSREPLNLADEQLVHLAALPCELNGEVSLASRHSTAALLFADRAHTANSAFHLTDENQATVELICAQLEGVPLALELAAAWADSCDLAQIREELREQLDIASKTEGVTERHRSVRASCDWSYGLLDEHLQLILRCMAVFKGGFSPDQAAQILPERELGEDLEQLTAKSWLFVRDSAHGLRYELHDAAIREYAFQKLLNSDDYEIAVQAHCLLFGNLLEQQCGRLTGPDQLDAMQTLGIEFENIIEALDSALHRTRPDWIQLFAQNLHRYMLMIGEARECRIRYEGIRDWCAGLDPAQPCAAADLGLAQSCLQIADYADAREFAINALYAAKSAEQPVNQARAEGVLGELDRIEGEHTAARFHYSNCLDLMRAAENRAGIAEALQGLGRIEITESNFAAARRFVSDSLELRRENGDRFGVARCLNDMGNMAYREGNYDEAHQLQTESLEIRRQLGDQHGIAQSLSNLGNVEFSRCDYPAAWTLYSKSHEIRSEAGNRFGIAACLNNLGNVEYCEGNYDNARELHEKGLSVKREIGDRIGISYSLNNLGNIATVQEKYPEAAGFLRGAIEIAVEVGSKECILAPLGVASCLFARQEQFEVAGVLHSGVQRLLKQLGLALDPMDGGMLAEAGRLVSTSTDSSLMEKIEARTGALDLNGLTELGLLELGILAGN